MTRRGFTLVEILIGLVVTSFLMAAAVSLFRSQSAGFRAAGERYDASQNLRITAATVERAIRTAGTGVAADQPAFVYGGADVVAFNADYSSNVGGPGVCAVYVNSDAPAGAYDVLPVGSASVLPTTSFTYPSKTYAASASCRAETIVLYFQADSATSEAGDYVLLQRTNVMPAEIIAKGLYRIPGKPFFDYLVHPLFLVSASRDSNVWSATSGSGITLPIVHSATDHGGALDLAPTAGARNVSGLADSVKAVRLNLRVTTTTGSATQSRDLSTLIPIPNNGLASLRTCGDPPLLTGALGATPSGGGAPTVTLTWTRSADEATGETDVTQYNIYRRLAAAPAFGSALLTIPATNLPTYTVADGSVAPGASYVYGVAAQDCSPSESALLASAAVTLP